MTKRERCTWIMTIIVPAIILCVAALAHGQASQPASQPAASSVWTAFAAWWAANWQWLVTAVLLPSLVTGLREKSLRAGLVGAVERVFERLSLVTPKNCPDTFKAPGRLGKDPT